jgi:Asparagine synthase/Glutamine amidotransferase domain
MLENEPSWLAVLGPRSRRADDADPSAIELTAEGKDSFSLRVHRGTAAEGPSLARGEGCAVLLDGRLHERRRLATAIGSDRRAADTDGELLLAAYLELGEQVLPLLRGSFTLIVWDGRTGSVLCIRDLTGSRPLFFSRAGDRTLVSASHGALLEVGRVPADLDRVAIARWVTSWSTLPRRTFYARIARLPPGYVLRAAPAGVGIRRYWHPGDQAPTEEATPSEVFRRFEELLDQAVARSASADRLGIFLSGGADSAAVAASAAFVSRVRSLPEPVALSLVYPEPATNEESTQRSVAAALAIPHRVVPLFDAVGRGRLLTASLRLTERLWMPPINPWEPGFVCLAEEGARLGCRAILTGEGGNDWFEAERLEAADLIRRLKLIALWRLWSRERQAGRPGSDAAKLLLWWCGCRPLARDLTLAVLGRVADDAPRAIRRRRLLSSLPSRWALPDGGLRTALVGELLEGGMSGRERSYRDSADLRKLESAHLVVGFENRFLVSRGLGVRFAEPAVDPDLVQFLYGLPNTLLNLGDRFKGLPRESVRRRAGEGPAALLGYAWLDAFLASLVRAEGPPALETLGGLRCLSELGIVDERAFSRELRGSGLGRRLSYYEAWQTLACEAWLRSRT